VPRSVSTREYIMALLYSRCMSYPEVLDKVREAIARTWPRGGDEGFREIRYLDTSDPGAVFRMLGHAGPG